MASKTLYPAIVDSYMPAFKAGNTSCKVYFSLSKFNGSSDFSSVHASVIKQSTGMNVVKTTDDAANNRYRSTGIILNLAPIRVQTEDNLYYVEINDSDLSSVSGSYSGWIPGWTYKIQLRLSSKNYDGTIGQAAWLNNNSSFFSEWSTICIVKAIGRIDYDIPLLGIDTQDSMSISTDQTRTVSGSTLNLVGSFYRTVDPSELIRSYDFTLYDETDNILETTGEIYVNQYQNSDTINYLMKTELEDQKVYRLAFHYITINGYEDGFYKHDSEKDDRFEFTCSSYAIEYPPCRLVTVENDSVKILDGITSIHQEEEDGRVVIKFYSETSDDWSGNLCLRRSSSRDNFKTWTDIYVYVAKAEDVNKIPTFYDYTIESGVWYKYGIQTISSSGDRGRLVEILNPVMRNFNYSFILGKDNKQLRLEFDNSMGNFKYQVSDSRIDPIGSKYTTIARNATTYYRTFPINGLISFWMDENELFVNQLDIYKYKDIRNLYNNYNTENNIVQYDYIYEREFREAVLEFLQDGEYKIFKSPTEGNIIVRLMDVNCVPNQSLGRMIYSFTSNAYEMDAPTMENYLKYGFYSVGDYQTSFAVYETKLGQLYMDMPVGGNIIQKIYEKYDSQNRNIAGYSKKIGRIRYLKITFDDKPLRVISSGGEAVTGNNFVYNGKIITVYDPVRMYEFDERITFVPSNVLTLLGDAEGKVSSVHITVDFIYDLEVDVYVAKQIQLRQTKQGIAQIFEECKPDTDLYKEITYKYRIEWPLDFQRLLALSSIEVEAAPGAVFSVKDSADAHGELHTVGVTGQLRFYEIETLNSFRYVGMRNSITGEIENKNTDVLLNYMYLVTKGRYKET